MTMPHLMNCSHSEDGWCLKCVKEQWQEMQFVKDVLGVTCDICRSVIAWAGVHTQGNAVQFREVMLFLEEVEGKLQNDNWEVIVSNPERNKR